MKIWAAFGYITRHPSAGVILVKYWISIHYKNNGWIWGADTIWLTSNGMIRPDEGKWTIFLLFRCTFPSKILILPPFSLFFTGKWTKFPRICGTFPRIRGSRLLRIFACGRNTVHASAIANKFALLPASIWKLLKIFSQKIWDMLPCRFLPFFEENSSAILR